MGQEDFLEISRFGSVTSLEETGAYEISYKVTTDQDTLVNPTNHSYFNLSGDFTQTIDRHVFQLNTEGIYPIAPDGVPAKTPDADRDVVKHIYNGALLKRHLCRRR